MTLKNSESPPMQSFSRRLSQGPKKKTKFIVPSQIWCHSMIKVFPENALRSIYVEIATWISERIH